MPRPTWSCGRVRGQGARWAGTGGTDRWESQQAGPRPSLPTGSPEASDPRGRPAQREVRGPGLRPVLADGPAAPSLPVPGRAPGTQEGPAASVRLAPSPMKPVHRTLRARSPCPRTEIPVTVPEYYPLELHFGN